VIRPWSSTGSSAPPPTASTSPGTSVAQGSTPARTPARIELAVYLRSNATDAQKQAIEAKLRAIPGATGITFETRERAYQRFKEMFKDKPALVAATKPDTMLESFRLILTDPAAAQPVVAHVSVLPGVAQVTPPPELLKPTTR